MEQKDFTTWQNLLDEQQDLLSDFLNLLKDEKQALLANQIDKLKESTLQKQKFLHQIETSEQHLQKAKTSLAHNLGLQTLSLNEIFNHLEKSQGKILQEKRQKLVRLSRQVQSVNRFNSHCLKTYLDDVHAIQSLVALATKETSTYSAKGQTTTSRHGKLLNRSF